MVSVCRTLCKHRGCEGGGFCAFHLCESSKQHSSTAHETHAAFIQLNVEVMAHFLTGSMTFVLYYPWF